MLIHHAACSMKDFFQLNIVASNPLGTRAFGEKELLSFLGAKAHSYVQP